MTSKQTKYATPLGLWSAAKARAIVIEKQTGAPVDQTLHAFIMQCLLARIASYEPDNWVLKGGVALLMSVPNARPTRDIDLFSRESELSVAIKAIRTALGIDLGDLFRFSILSTDPILSGATQRDTMGTRLLIGVQHGAKSMSPISIDLVSGSLMTAEPDPYMPTPLLEGVAVETVRLYPVIDHIADKVIATQTEHHNGRSKRHRDLLDLVIFARTQRIDGAALQVAIRQEWVHRNLAGSPKFDPPSEWQTGYLKLIKASGTVIKFPRFAEAVALVHALLNPTLEADPLAAMWEPAQPAWIPLVP